MKKIIGLFLCGLLICAPAWGANVKLSEIASGAGININTDKVVTVRSGASDVLTTLATSASVDTTNASNISSGTLNTARLPSPFTSGTASGNTASFATTTGTLTNGHCVSIDSQGNLLDAGGACTTGGGGGTVSAGTAGQLTYYASSGSTVAGLNVGSGLSISGGTITALAGAPTVSVLAQSNVQVSHTGDTAETTLVDYTLPANTLPANGILRITTLWSRNSGGTGSNTPRIRFGGISGTVYGTQTNATTQPAQSWQNFIYANNATNSQKGPIANNGNPFNVNVGPLITSTLDTTSAQHIVFTVQLANSSDTGNLEGYIIELLHP